MIIGNNCRYTTNMRGGKLGYIQLMILHITKKANYDIITAYSIKWILTSLNFNILEIWYVD